MTLTVQGISCTTSRRRWRRVIEAACMVAAIGAILCLFWVDNFILQLKPFHRLSLMMRGRLPLVDDVNGISVPSDHPWAATSGQTGGALVLTESNFRIYQGRYSVLFVAFYAPWCHYSRQLSAPWEEASRAIAMRHGPEEEPRVRFARLDCSEFPSFCLQHQIYGYPSIRIFTKGSEVSREEYDGKRDTASLLKMAESWLLLRKPQ